VRRRAGPGRRLRHRGVAAGGTRWGAGFS